MAATALVKLCACGCGKPVTASPYPSMQRQFLRGHSGRVAIADRFWSKVLRKDTGDAECWLWTSSTDGKGYGQIRSGRRTLKAHRVAWELTHGPITDGLGVLHRCDNPACCNPGHLFLGTPADNMQDAAAKGRTKPSMLRGSAHGNAKLVEREVMEILRRSKSGESERRLAAEFGVSGRVIHNIKTGKSWTHVTGGAL